MLHNAQWLQVTDAVSVQMLCEERQPAPQTLMNHVIPLCRCLQDCDPYKFLSVRNATPLWLEHSSDCKIWNVSCASQFIVVIYLLRVILKKQFILFSQKYTQVVNCVQFTCIMYNGLRITCNMHRVTILFTVRTSQLQVFSVWFPASHSVQCVQCTMHKVNPARGELSRGICLSMNNHTFADTLLLLTLTICLSRLKNSSIIA